MAGLQIEQIRNLDDFAVLYKWDVWFTPPAAVAFDRNELNVRCLSSTIPTSSVQSIDIQIRGHHIKQAGIVNDDQTINLTFAETVDNTVHNMLNNWREALWATNTGKQVKRAEYQCDMLLTRLNNQNEPIWTYKLIGCYLENIDWGGQLGGDTSDIIRPSVTLSYDYFKMGAGADVQ
ncbi:hypothetical protein CWB96_00330 [Pseudoalteromonas citrea]|uniref:Phage tail protein n=1 Tax=Pseudoalteromonas citrea TaxID=43655 RepID=A0A5S3XVA8_9GAMM|nr:hypothetical protein [Pseudoalteromonas citrea]TMP46313.1 hypothetical protein CWB97_02325 [Pseudoalteromonas citrea]TMP63089.1 hypothetical protein CWB96_00330 [Pseudoalteromonas citrea]